MCRRAEWMSIGVVGFYSAWLLLCGIVNGAFPYPFMNAMPWPHVRLLELGTLTRAGVFCGPRTIVYGYSLGFSWVPDV